MHQFFVEPCQIAGKRITITGKDVNHIVHVLRMKPGEELSVSNGVDGKEYRCQIECFTDGEVQCRLRFIKEDGLELPARVSLFQGLPKGDKMELISQKAVELGVFEVFPMATKRAVVRLEGKREAARIARWQSIAEAAAAQSRRHIIPQVHPVISLKEAVALAARADCGLIPYELAEGMGRTRELLGGIHPGQSVAVMIGPEGGFEEEEIALAQAAGIWPITMGRRILRTETAGLTMLAWIMYQLEAEA